MPEQPAATVAASTQRGVDLPRVLGSGGRLLGRDSDGIPGRRGCHGGSSGASSGGVGENGARDIADVRTRAVASRGSTRLNVVIDLAACTVSVAVSPSPQLESRSRHSSTAITPPPPAGPMQPSEGREVLHVVLKDWG